MSEFLTLAEHGVYWVQGLAALSGAFWVILLLTRMRQKRFASPAAADQFLDDVRDHLAQQDINAVANMCDSPAYWSKAVPQLVLVAMHNIDRPMSKLKRLLAEKFEREILAGLEYGVSWINALVKVAPMLGLLGTVMGMINSFGKLALSTGGADPNALAHGISLALQATMFGLLIAIPLIMTGNWIQVRIGKLQDSVQQDLTVFLEDLEETRAAQGASA